MGPPSIGARTGLLAAHTFVPVGLVANQWTEHIEPPDDINLCSNSHNFAPPPKRFVSTFPMFDCGDQLAASVEGVVDNGVDSKKSLGQAT